ncbi:hypothetical protein BDY21DRAFT_393900 [Lineolata rhizophorae]|uniref:RING-type domain-containing protein n=1 Tax=Lineolata rhizophorae TaxID=578093 RepID=A0A6A6NXM6_9PEZI|nr:hypothetical protein BDY21DRAFT_393900 [Lineolata rhizophorae]
MEGTPVASGPSGLVDLEKELTCSICTDVLYQPLTLLDCLHTFCGACLKEWFTWQASRSKDNANPYSCPSCRATVRGTKPDAKVFTLLDMYLRVNPGRGKSDKEKEDIAKSYMPGDNVMPEVRITVDPDEEAERRMLDEAMAESLREVGIPAEGHAAPSSGSRLEPEDRRRREASRERRSRDRRNRERSARGSSNDNRQGQASSRSTAPDPRQPAPHVNIPPRQVEHQSSLRSLLSATELDSQEMEEEIMRQILEEGLLEGIDLNNIDVSQEEEISERIAEAYRRRQRDRDLERGQERERARERGARGRESRARTSQSQTRSQTRAESQSRRRQHVRSDSSTQPASQQSRDPRPPVSRPHLFDAVNDGNRRHRRRASSQGSSGRQRSDSSGRLTTDAHPRPATRSANDLPDRSQTFPEGSERHRPSAQHERRITDPENVRRADNQRVGQTRSDSQPTQSPRRAVFDAEISNTTTGPVSSGSAVRTSPRPGHDATFTLRPRRASIGTPGTPESPTSDQRPSSSSAAPPPQPRHLYTEPSISCDKCGKGHIEHDLHFNCPKCNDGKFNICLQCYRLGQGCLHWYGFGHAAAARYEQRAPPEGYPPDHERPHELTGHRYQRPKHSRNRKALSNDPRRLVDEDPAKRLQVGVFCDICQAFANSCYWKCETCNDGAWGFCNTCVNQGRHCTHPLLPLTHKGGSASKSSPDGASLSGETAAIPSSPPPPSNPNHGPLPAPPLTPKSASLIRGPTNAVFLANMPFRPLTFSTTCDLCRYPIPPSRRRFHCPRCAAGDYDVCASCYHSLVASGRVAPDNGHAGWRRCLRGHRMVVVGYEDRAEGQCRVVDLDLVGGLGLDEGAADAAVAAGGSPPPPAPLHSRFPPSGGVGLRAVAVWSYYPPEGVTDELMFPRGAEIREAANINEAWFWGSYAGRQGLFPGNYVRLLP